MKKKFWVWDKVEENILRIDGVIAQDSWFGDEITPAIFKQELNVRNGDITLWLNSPGGDVFGAVMIYNMLMEYQGNVTIKIDSLAASAASVIAMAGSQVLMSPSSLMMVHDPMSIIFGNERELASCIEMLKEVKEAIINAYELKTGAQRAKLAQFMSNETWFNAKKAVEWGFADGILYKDKQEAPPAEAPPDDPFASFMYGSRTLSANIVNKLKASIPKVEPEEELLIVEPPDEILIEPPDEVPKVTEPTVTEPTAEVVDQQPAGTPAEHLFKRLSLLNR